VPTLLVCDQDCFVRFAHVQLDYTEIADTIAALPS